MTILAKREYHMFAQHGADRRKVGEVVFVRHVVAVPRHNVKHRGVVLHGPQLAHELVHDRERTLAILERGHCARTEMREHVARPTRTKAPGILKSRGLARPLAPIGPSSGKRKWPLYTSHT